MWDDFELTCADLQKLVGKKAFWERYIPLIVKSINLEGTATEPYELIPMLGKERFGVSWEKREEAWYSKEDVYAVDLNSGEVLTAPYAATMHRERNLLPLFKNYVNSARGRLNPQNIRRAIFGNDVFIAGDEIKEEKTKEDTMINKNKLRNTASEVADANKDAMEVAARISTGRAANRLFLSKIAGKLPWYAKLFGKKKELENNPLAKLVTAEVAVALTKHLAPDNKKLDFISESMLEDAMIDVTANTKMFEKLLDEIDSVVVLPESLRDAD